MNNFYAHCTVCLSKDSTTSFIVFNLTFAVVLSNVKVGKLVFIEKLGVNRMLVKSRRNKNKSHSVNDHKYFHPKSCLDTNIRNCT